MILGLLFCLFLAVLSVMGWVFLFNVNEDAVEKLYLLVVHAVAVVFTSYFIKDAFNWETWSIVIMLIIGFSVYSIMILFGTISFLFVKDKNIQEETSTISS